MAALLWLLGTALVLVGLAGVVLPALPGAWFIVAGLALAAWADDFTRVGVGTVGVIALVGLASYGIDFVASAVGVRRLGASPRAMAGAMLGTLAGLFFGLPGIVLGPFLGAVAGEWSVHREWRQAGRAGIAAWIGFALGTALKVAVAFLMIGLFLIALLV